MFKKGTKLYSIFRGKCPRCHEGDFFKNKFTLQPSKITEIHAHCSNCNLKYMLEPSFFYGAMYVNYGLTVAISVASFVIAKLIFGLTLLHSFLVIILSLVILAPVSLRLSRILWINMFVSFDKKFTKKND
ncbi:MAG: DUF983 domain-containing protein [Flavobacteriia bacterium]|nr:DUF983 domain-containing protein [Flavobacteriia bacterium]OIP48123.1 MAG: DUF983 domain-containing protein [Flavobacteriaceae bacterium CG2_30_31_66]PIV97831.1 MAG: DUF983 domain-containing protein [Flavobacteriaceae bacterium CG17_big_fil_post_rev_8_21_14_2_50_31_13]PIX11587.1 MAG: DUF983 domain-containing protein [Flavobacteriaceae bacterium CG_4_8_14_3_um_filter_31_8]PIY14572.1 MAG: DUF983 domain-containing protein [Flavobacteriaceae bacterium CG_4_10_14_3_um_filter_31_253]PIZ10840.1 MA